MSRVVHFEIHAKNPDQICRFYSEVFGWKIQKWEGPIDYWLITTGEAKEIGINGGMCVRRGDSPAEGAPVNAYVCTIGTNSVDETLEHVQSAGGQLALPKMAIPGIGWLAYCKDPDGNLFGVMEPDEKAT